MPHPFCLEKDGFVVVSGVIPMVGGDQKEVSVDVGNLKLRIYQGDITQAGVDAIVNGTNNEMDLTQGNLVHCVEFFFQTYLLS